MQKAESWNIMSNSGMGRGGVKGARDRVCSRDNPEPVRGAIVFPDSANGGSESCIFGMPSRTSRDWPGPAEGEGTGFDTRVWSAY